MGIGIHVASFHTAQGIMNASKSAEKIVTKNIKVLADYEKQTTKGSDDSTHKIETTVNQSAIQKRFWVYFAFQLLYWLMFLGLVWFVYRFVNKKQGYLPQFISAFALSISSLFLLLWCLYQLAWLVSILTVTFLVNNVNGITVNGDDDFQAYLSLIGTPAISILTMGILLAGLQQ
jgi:hypothetical protein